MIKHLKLIISFCALLLVTSCSDDDDVRIYTGKATDITDTTATITCELDANKNIINHECGIVYSEFRDEVVDCNGRFEVSKVKSKSHFTITIDLSDEFGVPFPNTYFFYRGYVIYDGVTHWGEVMDFRTPYQTPEKTPEESSDEAPGGSE